MKKIYILITLLFLVSAAPAFAEVIVNENQATYLIHFGRGAEAKAVNHMDFHTFIAKEVTPVFPAGLTIIDAKGQWTTPKYGLIRENSTIVEIICDEDPSVQDKINQIAENYVKTFKNAQVGVFIVKFPSTTSFIIE